MPTTRRRSTLVHGRLKVKADGSYSFTADTPVTGPGGAASATFTVTDGDLDTATATVSFVVTDANVPTAGTAAAAVDDDGLRRRAIRRARRAI